MNKFIKYYIALLVAVLFTACAEDKGNYEYHDINEVTILGINEGETVTKVSFIDHLVIDPQITSSAGRNNENDYEYTWKMLPAGADFDKIENIEEAVISHERKIDQLVTWEPGDYSMFFIVKDKQNGLCTTASFKLRVKSTTSEGWMVLCDDNGKARMDIIFNVDADNDLIAHNIWQASDFDPGKPVRIIYNYNLHETAALLVTDKSTYNLDVTDLHAGEDNELKWRFGIPPEGLRVKASAMSQFSINNMWVIVNEKDEVYALDRSVNNSMFEFPINKVDGTTDFKAAPFVGVSYNNQYSGGYGCAPAVLYDMTHRQFLIIRNNSQYPSPITFSGSTMFTAETGRDMVWMESAKDGRIYSILRDPADNRLYFYCFELRANYTPGNYWWEEGKYEEYNIQHYYGEVLGDGLANASMFAVNHQFPYIFYANGNSIYQFDMGHPDEEAKEVLNFPGETIRTIKFCPMVAWEQYEEWERQRGYQLVVATVKDGVDTNECGVVRIYDVPNLMAPLVKQKEYTGLGNIVDITYKERKK